MIKSMTGFGRSQREINNKRVTIDIKTLNSKQVDINARMPLIYREKEIVIRKLLSEKLVRGKIDLNISIENLSNQTATKINHEVVKSYFAELQELNNQLHLPTDSTTLKIVMRIPDVLTTEVEQLDDAEWKEVEQLILETIEKVDAFRLQEGKALEKDVTNNINQISSLLKSIEPFESQRIENIRQRISENLNSLSLENIDDGRLEQELIYYIEKLDINEEKVRLANHCKYFLQTVNNATSSGKKLNFIGQEIGREINTIGSKSNETNIQHLVVQMKDHLERIKEQLLNIL